MYSREEKETDTRWRIGFKHCRICSEHRKQQNIEIRLRVVNLSTYSRKSTNFSIAATRL